jgi:hypothetical protein
MKNVNLEIGDVYVDVDRRETESEQCYVVAPLLKLDGNTLRERFNADALMIVGRVCRPGG